MYLAQSFLLRKAGELMELLGFNFNYALATVEAQYPKVALRAKGN